MHDHVTVIIFTLITILVHQNVIYETAWNKHERTLKGMHERRAVIVQCVGHFVTSSSLFSQEHRDEYLTSIPQEVCLSFVKIIQEVLGSPPDLALLRLVYNFLLAVHPPTNTYVCHTPSSFYFSLHIGEQTLRKLIDSLWSFCYHLHAFLQTCMIFMMICRMCTLLLPLLLEKLYRL